MDKLEQMNSPQTDSDLQSHGALPRMARKSLAEQVADELRNLVLLEKLKPGAAIPERETAEALGVSRTPLRESLRILASEGLVDIAPNRAPRVADPSLSDIRSLLQVQGVLEALAGELACEVGSDAELKAIHALEKEMQRVSDSCEPVEFFKMDMRFHESIVAASKNQALVTTHKTYNTQLWRARFIASRTRVNRVGILEQHSEIAEALISRQSDNCARALRRHLEFGFRSISKVFRESE